MNYLLNNPKSQKSMSDEELVALAIQNKEKAKARRKKGDMQGCNCYPVDPPKGSQTCNVENDLRKDFDICDNWRHPVSLFLS